MRILFLFACFSLLSFRIQDNTVSWQKNINEYHKAISNLERSIWSLKGYIIDTANDHWTAIDPMGYYSFEGYKSKPDDYDYAIKIKGYIYSPHYFDTCPRITCSYVMYRDNPKGEKEQHNFDVNCHSDAFADDLPFKLKDIKVVYVEKEIDLISSKVLVFDRSRIEETYIVTYKNNTVKKFMLDQTHGTFQEVK